MIRIEKAERHGEAGTLKVDGLREVARVAASLRRWQQIAGSLDGPGDSPVEAASEARFFRPGRVLLMARGWLFFEISGAESDQDFVAPGPDAVIRRPSAEPSRLAVHEDAEHVDHVFRR